MKTNKIILTAIAGVLVVILIVGLLIMRSDIRTIIAGKGQINYQTVAAEKFDKLNFNGNWSVRILPGRVCKVELGTQKQTLPENKVVNNNGTLYLELIKPIDNEIITTIYARITVPSLKKVEAQNGTTIQMENYTTDSILFVLGDSSSFIGKDNQFGQVNFNTTGKASIQIKKTL